MNKLLLCTEPGNSSSEEEIEKLKKVILKKIVDLSLDQLKKMVRQMKSIYPLFLLYIDKIKIFIDEAIERKLSYMVFFEEIDGRLARNRALQNHLYARSSIFLTIYYQKKLQESCKSSYKKIKRE